jgi:hypothetical protein
LAQAEKRKLRDNDGDSAVIVLFSELGRSGKLLWVLRRVAATWGRVLAAQPVVFISALLAMLLPLIIAAVGVQSTLSLITHGPWLVALVIVWLMASLLVATAAASRGWYSQR